MPIHSTAGCRAATSPRNSPTRPAPTMASPMPLVRRPFMHITPPEDCGGYDFRGWSNPCHDLTKFASQDFLQDGLLVRCKPVAEVRAFGSKNEAREPGWPLISKRIEIR